MQVVNEFQAEMAQQSTPEFFIEDSRIRLKVGTNASLVVADVGSATFVLRKSCFTKIKNYNNYVN